MNMHWEAHWFELPKLVAGMKWHVSRPTPEPPSPGDCWPIGEEPVLSDQSGMLVGERSVVVLVGRRS